MWGYIKQRNIYLKQTIPTATSVSIIKQIARELRHDKNNYEQNQIICGKIIFNQYQKMEFISKPT